MLTECTKFPVICISVCTFYMNGKNMLLSIGLPMYPTPKITVKIIRFNYESAYFGVCSMFQSIKSTPSSLFFGAK